MLGTVARWLTGSSLFLIAAAALAQEPAITRIWLSHRSPDPNKVVVNWESSAPGESQVVVLAEELKSFREKADPTATLHHVEIDVPQRGEMIRYQVQTGAQTSPAGLQLRAYPKDDALRVAVVADWHSRANLDALIADKIHILCTAGDNIPSLHARCGVGVKDCTKPYGELIDGYPELFRTVRFMPCLGNHDREIRPRGDKPPADSVYDVDATAYRKFFELPDDEWKWHFDLREFGLRLVALDLNHIQDQGTTWQTCHPLTRESEQFRWYEKLLKDEPQQPWTVTLHNEKSGNMRGQEKGAWHDLFRRGTLAATGFGYFAERAEVDGFPYYNTALGVGAKYKDAKAEFFESTASYLLLTSTPLRLTVELKSLDGKVLDAKTFKK
ncbi:metallophosphoesterase family protein [Anatilimnocola floriformis]|uniref:metallophosphoesterase family protein n=1 Tax=Anatilimnocola floriformis TaxID=2948575 RepID=UPI0020C28F39|nr:metallophosphoesterase [Anatilimnocola floriformis]